MLSAEAARLAIIEVLCPTAARLAGSGFPTLAGVNILDSRSTALQDLDPDRDYTPTVAVYTHSASITRRADAADAADNDCMTEIDIVCELAVGASDETGATFADALAGDDPEARLVLAALTSQVRNLLDFSQSGVLFRDTIIGVRKIDEDAFAVPELGLRWQRTTMRLALAICDDRFDQAAGGMPEPMATLYARLPAASYAKAKLAQLASVFASDIRTPLAGIAIFDDPQADPATDSPVASTGDINA